MKPKKISKTSVIIFGLILLSLVLVGALALKDTFLTPVEQYKIAVTALENGHMKKAERYFLLACQSKESKIAVPSAYYLGQMYEKGAPGFPINGPKAALFYEQAAVKGLAPAQYNLALMYDIGDKIPENRAKALNWMNQAAQAGYPDALYGLGVWIERGYLGDDIPMNRVVKLYEEAALKGQKNARASLVAIYSGGFGGFPSNLERAAYWMNELKKQNESK